MCCSFFLSLLETCNKVVLVPFFFGGRGEKRGVPFFFFARTAIIYGQRNGADGIPFIYLLLKNDTPFTTYLVQNLKLQGLHYYFPKNSRCNLLYYESEKFTDSSLHHIFESEIVGFLFSTKNKSEMCNIRAQKIVGNLLHELRKLYMKETVSRNFYPSS